MSENDGLYRGDPSAGDGPPAYGPPAYGPPAYGPPAYGPPGYGPPGYGPPAYGPPGYGPPAGYGPPGYYRRPTNQLAVAALVLAFVFAPAGLVLGIIARKQIARSGEEGAGMALAGIIIGSIAVAGFVLLMVFYLVVFVSLTDSLN